MLEIYFPGIRALDVKLLFEWKNSISLLGQALLSIVFQLII